MNNATPTKTDLGREVSIFDQYFMVSSLNSEIGVDGSIKFSLVPNNYNKQEKGYVILNQETLSNQNLIEMEVDGFFIPKLPSWNNKYIAYKRKIGMRLGAIENFAVIDYRINTAAVLDTYKFNFEFNVSDESDRYYLTPTDITKKIIFRQVISLPTANSIYFTTPEFDLPLITPYINVSFVGVIPGYGLGAGAAGFAVSNPAILNYYSNNYIVFNTPNIPGVNYRNIYQILSVVSLPGVVNPIILIDNLIIDTTTFPENSPCILCNLTLEVRIPFKTRQVQPLDIKSNRITPIA